jgi:TRAP transporter TAXI family solute receptor
MKELCRIYALPIILTIAGFIVAFQFVDPAPPREFAIATGSEEGAYFHSGTAYSDVLERDGITVEVKATAGSVENLSQLAAGQADVALIQGGTESLADSDNLVALGSVMSEPLWIFHRPDIDLSRLTDLRGLRLAAGREGSGTLAVIRHLLEDNGILNDVALNPASGTAALDVLRSGDIDAVAIVAAPTAPIVGTFLTSQDIRPMSFRRAEACTRRHRFLRQVTLPEGAFDPRNNIPDRDIVLVAPAAQLVASRDFHPALVDLLLQAAAEVHRDGDLLSEPGAYPTAEFVGFDLSKEAQRYFDYGPPLLQRYLPFWAATLVDRLKIMAVPLIALALPLIRIMPPLYRWRIRSRIYRWYREVDRIDTEARQAGNHAPVADQLQALDHLQDQVSDTPIPLSYHDELYDLKMHIDLIRDHLKNRADRRGGSQRKE